MSFLVDANVLSEATKRCPDPAVVDWLTRNEPEIAVDPVILGEIRFGILFLPAGARRHRLEQWFEAGVEKIHCLPWDAATGLRWAQLLADLRAAEAGAEPGSEVTGKRSVTGQDQAIALAGRALGRTRPDCRRVCAIVFDSVDFGDAVCAELGGNPGGRLANDQRFDLRTADRSGDAQGLARSLTDRIPIVFNVNQYSAQLNILSIRAEV